MEEMKEEWRPVPIEGFGDTYSISDLGRLKSNGFSLIDKLGRHWTKIGRIVKPRINQGYHKVSLTKDGKKHYFQAHQLVARVFILNPENKPFINHKDGNGLNNRVDNLEWCTQSENMHHSYYTLKKQGCKNKPVKQLSLCGDLVKVWPGVNAAARGLNQKGNRDIFNALKGRSKSSLGFKWEYA